MATRVVPGAGKEHFADMHFPAGGIDISMPFDRQPPRQIGPGEYARSAPMALNVRSFEPQAGRRRGGSRSGLRKYISTSPVPGWVSQALAMVVWTGGGSVQTSSLGRVVTLVQVQQGLPYYVTAGGTAWTSAVNKTPNSPPLNFNGVMFAAANSQKLWFADGMNWCYFNPADGSINPWVPGTVDLQGNALPSNLLPVGSDGGTPRIIENWRNRIVLSGLIKSPQDVFFSAVGDPTNFCYSPLSFTPLQAFAANANSTIGQVGDVVTAFIPYSDDVAICGGDHSISMFNGDPAYGGKIDLLTGDIGIAFGRAWCKDSYGTLYFFSNKCGIYTLVPGQQPQRISQAIEQLATLIDTGNNAISLAWNDRFQGLHIFATPLAGPGPTGSVTHFFWEQRTGGWFTDQFASPGLDPLCCLAFDGNTAGDRVVLLGCYDGYVRAMDPAATTDDGLPINATVVIGPIIGEAPETLLADILLKDIQVVLGETSGQVTYQVLVGRSAEAALASTPVASGTLNAGRNLLSGVRRSGHAIYLVLTGPAWTMEVVKARIAGREFTGKVRQRGR